MVFVWVTETFTYDNTEDCVTTFTFDSINDNSQTIIKIESENYSGQDHNETLSNVKTNDINKDKELKTWDFTFLKENTGSKPVTSGQVVIITQTETLDFSLVRFIVSGPEI